MLVRVLKAPRGFGARLPFGPPTQESLQSANAAADLFMGNCVDRVDVDSDFPKLMHVIEGQLTTVAGLDNRQAEAHAGRAAGPEVMWRSAMDLATGLTRTTPASSAWEKTHRWLSTLLTLMSIHSDDVAVGADAGATTSRQFDQRQIAAMRLRRAITLHDHQLGHGR